MGDKKRNTFWIGSVDEESYSRFVAHMQNLLAESNDPINLFITSGGGDMAVAFALYDMIKFVLKPCLTTIALGEINSAGIVLYMAGQQRLIGPNCSMLFHQLGRSFKDERLPLSDLKEIVLELERDHLRYAEIIADNSNGMTSTDKILQLMEKTTFLTAKEALAGGIAHKMIVADELEPLP